MSEANKEFSGSKVKKSYCKNFNAIAKKTPYGTADMMIVRLRCKEWSCDYCARKNMAIWRAHIIDRVNALAGEWAFITITAHRNAHKARKTVENLKRVWKLMYDRINRKFGGSKAPEGYKTIEYVMLYEQHAEGGKATYHIHAILRMHVEGENEKDKKTGKWKHQALTTWLKDNAAECGGGFMAHGVKIKDANAGLVSAYITKYMTKKAQAWLDFPPRARRIGVSRGFGSPKNNSEGGWIYGNGIHYSELDNYDSITDLSTGETLRKGMFGEHGFYPDYENDADE